MKNVPTVPHCCVNAYRMGFQEQQAQMLHDRIEGSEFPSSLAVAKTRQLITGLEVPFDELATSLDLSRVAKRQGQRTLRRAVRRWDDWTLQDPDRRWCLSPARGDLSAFNRLVDDMAQINPDLEVWYRLGQEMANLYHASPKNWQWRWAHLSRIKELCAQAGVGLAQLSSVSEADFPSEPDYPEELWGWYHVEAGMRKLLQNAVILERNDEKDIPGFGNGVALGQTGLNVDKKSLAIALLYQHPDWSIKKIAKEAGLHRSTLHECKEFMQAKAVLKQGRQEFPHGFKSDDFEAFDEKGSEIARQNKRHVRRSPAEY